MSKGLIFKGIGYYLVWLVFTLFFGLLQMWWDLFDRLFTTYDVSFDEYYLNGGLLFFSSGIVSASAYSIWFSKYFETKSTLYKVAIHIILPLMVLIMTTMIYSNVQIRIENPDILWLQQFSQNLILGSSVIYSSYVQVRTQNIVA